MEILGRPTGERVWALPDDVTVEAVRDALAGIYGLEPGRRRAGSTTFYDTFEWRLWHADRLLMAGDGRVRLMVRDGGWMGAKVGSMVWPEDPPGFADAYPAGPLADALRSLAFVRRLSCIGCLTIEEEEWTLLGGDPKPVGRVVFGFLRAESEVPDTRLRVCRIRPAKGGRQVARSVGACLRAEGLRPLAQPPLKALLCGPGRGPSTYTRKPAYNLDGTESAREAVRLIVSRLLDVAQLNEPGILEDGDTEFLHDYRIAVRAVRSVLTRLRGVFPTGQTETLVAAFADMTRVTNRLRDLDVHLLSLDDYRRLLPDSLHDGLTEMGTDFARERVAEHERVCRHLQSESYRRHSEGTRAFFTQPDTLPESRYSGNPIRKVVSPRIYNRYRRIVKASAGLTMDSPDEQLHEVRIHGKRFRYLLEMFGDLYDPGDIDRLLRRLRRLQNRLGRFNDYSVQQASFRAYWDGPGRSHNSPELALSLGALMGALHREQIRQRKRSLAVMSSLRGGQVEAICLRNFKKT